MKRPITLVPLMILLLLPAGSRAFADCAASPQEIVWSWPGKGMLDIPVNAGIFVVPAATHSVTVRLNDQLLTPLGQTPPESWSYDPGMLAPNSVQKLVIEFAAGNGTQKTLPAREFTTGTGTATAETPVVSGHVERDPDASFPTDEACARTFSLLDCLDSGIGALFELTMSSTAPGWALQSQTGGPWMVFGEECAPLALTITNEEDPCFDLVSLGPTASLSATTSICPRTTSYPTADAGGCATSRGPFSQSAPMSLMLCALALVLRRRHCPPESL